MVLQQAEGDARREGRSFDINDVFLADGYSVFVVMQTNPEGPLALTRTDADVLASTIPEPTSSGRGTQIQRSGMEAIEGVEDEDLELQAALQASLYGGSHSVFVPNNPLPVRSTIPLPGSGPSSAAASGIVTPTGVDMLDDDLDSTSLPDLDEMADPVAASLARNQRLLSRMQKEQQAAQRELWDEQGDDEQSAHRRRELAEEEEMLRRAIEESEAMAQQSGSTDMRNLEAPTPPPSAFPQAGGGRFYDDEDAELQAALKASLEHPGMADVTSSSTTPTAPSALNAASISEDAEMKDADTSIEAEESEAAKPADMDEIRRRRLARFGG